MRKSVRKIQIYLFFSMMICIGIFPSSIYCKTIYTSDTLIANSNQLDGKTITFCGEVVGDFLQRGDHCWVNVYDGSQAIGIYCKTKMAQHITFFGDYKHTGDMVEVRGVFHKACKEHRGELDIHAEYLRIIKTGVNREHPLSKSRLYLALSLLVCTALIVRLHINRKKNHNLKFISHHEGK